MNYRGYSERELISNRSSLLLYGATEAERRLWAEEAASNFESEGPVRVANSPEEFQAAIAVGRGVVYLPDVAKVGDDVQRKLVLMLHVYDDRPKLIIGLSRSPDAERDAGVLRNELHYALQLAHVNLDAPGVKEAIRSRRAAAPKRRAEAPKAQQPVKPAAPAAKARNAARTAGRPAPSVKASGKKAKPRPAARKVTAAKPKAAKKPAKKAAARRRR